MLKNYYDDLLRLIFRPILFYTRLPEGVWYEKPVSFVGITSVILAFFATFVVFITQYIPIGATLLEKVIPSKYIIISPVMLVLAFMFFVITFTIIFGVLLAALLLLFWALAIALFLTAVSLGGKGDYLKNIKALFYLAGTALVFVIPILFIVLAKKKLMDFTNFSIGYNMLYSFWVLYLYGVLAIIARKIFKLEKSKAFICALVPVIFLIIVGILVHSFILPKFSGFIV